MTINKPRETTLWSCPLCLRTIGHPPPCWRCAEKPYSPFKTSWQCWLGWHGPKKYSMGVRWCQECGRDS